MFAVLDDIIHTTVQLLAESAYEGSELSAFDRAILNRGLNMLEASRTLLANGHWEVAAAPARQLFELLVNMEYLAQQPDRKDACFRYQKFALMQTAERARREIDYDRSTSRPVDEERAKQIAAVLSSPSFDEFRTRDGKWKSSWSAQSARALAEQSPARMRVKQWELLFVTWSEETHAAPVALLDAMLPHNSATWVETQVAHDDREVGQMILMVVTLYLELCAVLPNAPTPNPEMHLEWMTAMTDEVRARGQAPRDPDEVVDT
jgi:hypothetical protein